MPASAKHSQTMSKDWYAETCMPYGLHIYRRTFFMYRPISKPCLSGYGLALPAPAKRFAETSRRDECTSRCRAWGCHTYIFSVLSGGSLNPPPLSRKGWLAPLSSTRRRGGGLGMVFPPAKHVPRFGGNDMLQIQL